MSYSILNNVERERVAVVDVTQELLLPLQEGEHLSVEC